MTQGSLSAAAMRELVAAGDAVPLLTGFDVGPTAYDGSWWYVPSDAGDDADFQPAGPELAAEFDRLRARSERIDSLSTQTGQA